MALATLCLATLTALSSMVGQVQTDFIKWRTYKDGAYSSAKAQQIIVMNTSGDWQRYVKDFDPANVGDAKDVSWGEEQLVAIHIGNRNTGGYGVQVEDVSKIDPHHIKVSWSERTPPKNLQVTQSVTSPFTIVRIQRSGADLVFGSSKFEGLPGGIKIIQGGGNANGWGSCGCCEACERDWRNRLPYRIYDQGYDSPIPTRTTYVMSSPQEFDSYVRNFQNYNIGNGDDINWYRERLIAIHLGRKMTPGYDPIIESVKAVDDRRINVSCLELQPAGGFFSPRTATGPYIVLRVPRVGSVTSFAFKNVKAPYVLSNCDCNCGHCRCDP